MSDTNNDPPVDLLSNGFNDYLGLKIDQWSEKHSRISLTLRPEHLNRSGTLHGGVSTSLLDVAGGLAVCFCPVPGNVRRAVTLDLATHFTGQAVEGTVYATGKVISGGFKTVFVEANLHNDKGVLLATAQGTYQYRKGSESLNGQPVDS